VSQVRAASPPPPRQPTEQPIHAARPAEDRQFVTALARGLEVLRCFSAEQPELGSREIARSIGLSQPTVWRLCYTLSQLGYLVPGATPGKLRVGAPALALGAASLEALRFTQVIEPHLRAYIGRHPAAVVLAQRHQMTMLYLLRCEGDAHFIMKHPAGASVPLLQTAFGWTCLAGMPEPMFERIAAEVEATTPRRLRSLRRHVEDARAQIAERGFVTSIGVDHPSIHYVSTPLLSPDGTEAYALLCGGPAFELTPELLEQVLGPRLVKLGEQVRAALPGTRYARGRPE
jgi:DNA-binding IclR family transcriptional regulator